MTDFSARKSLASLAVLACTAILAVAASLGVAYAHWDWLSTFLAAFLIVVCVIGVRLLLGALDEWMGRADRDGKHHGQ